MILLQLYPRENNFTQITLMTGITSEDNVYILSYFPNHSASSFPGPYFRSPPRNLGRSGDKSLGTSLGCD